MKRLFILTVTIFILIVNQVSAQQVVLKTTQASQPPAPSQYVHEYYIYLDGITSVDEVEYLVDTIQKKSGVTYFLNNRYPVRYFLLKSKQSVDETEFAKWIGPKFQIAYYKEGHEAKEGAILLFYKQHPFHK
jgi:hypothetical protein